jgi:hypothetical protein
MFGNRQEKLENRQGKFDNRQVKFENRQVKFGNLQVKSENRQGKFDNRQVKFENRQVKFGNLQVKFENRQVKFENRQVKFENRQVKFENPQVEFGNLQVKFDKSHPVLSLPSQSKEPILSSHSSQCILHPLLCSCSPPRNKFSLARALNFPQSAILFTSSFIHITFSQHFSAACMLLFNLLQLNF